VDYPTHCSCRPGGEGEGEIKNQRVLIDYTLDKERLGIPDGMTVDK